MPRSNTGLLSSVSLATGELKTFAYDNLGRKTDTIYPTDPSGNVTPQLHEAYDLAGRVTSRTTSALGTETLSYDAAGAVISVTEPASLGGGTISYGYYADGMRSRAGYAAGSQSYPNALQYAYRAEGKRDRLTLGNGTAFSWTYTAAGRLLTQADPLTGTTVHPDFTVDSGGGYYPGTATYGPLTQAFDDYGRVVTLTMPVTLFWFGESQYDLEDGIAQHTVDAYAGPSGSRKKYNSAGIVCLTSNIRNEKSAGLTPYGSAGCSHANGQNLNGLQLTEAAVHKDWGSPQQWTIDARAGV